MRDRYIPAMESYRGYIIKAESEYGSWRCSVTPMRSELPILWRYSLHYRTERDAVVDAKRRVDEALALDVRQ